MKILSLTIAAAVALFAATLNAQTIVDLEAVGTGQWLPENPFVASGGGTDGSGWAYQNLAQGTIQSTSAGNPVVQSGTFSVAYAQNTDGTLGYDLEVQDRPSDGVLQVGSSSNSGTYDLNRGILLWDKSDFLGGGSSQQVNITADDAFSASFEALRGSNNRWVVEVGGQLYASVENFTSTSSTSSSITSTMWQPFTIGTLTNTPDTSWADLGTAQSLTLDNVTAVGFYLDGAARNNNVTGFSVEATVIPEPATAVLLGSALGFLLVSRRRRRMS